MENIFKIFFITYTVGVCGAFAFLNLWNFSEDWEKISKNKKTILMVLSFVWICLFMILFEFGKK